jgi:hypothetical protein
MQKLFKSVSDYTNPQTAFNLALDHKFLVLDCRADNYVCNFMFMGIDLKDNCLLFKHINTRKYSRFYPFQQELF